MTLETASRWYFNTEWGFNSTPPEEAGVNLLRAISICAQGDGELSEAERQWIVGFGAIHNLSPSALDGVMAYEASDDIASVVESDPLVAEFGRRATAYLAMRAARSDGELAPGEKVAIEGMAKQAGLSAELVSQLFALVEAEDKLKALRRQLILPEGAPF